MVRLPESRPDERSITPTLLVHHSDVRSKFWGCQSFWDEVYGPEVYGPELLGVDESILSIWRRQLCRQ